MKFGSLFAFASLTGVLVSAAPTAGSAANIIKRSESGASIIDFDYVLNNIRDINARYLRGDANSLQRRDDDEFINQLMVELHNSNLLDSFVDQLTAMPHLTEAVHEGVKESISSGLVDETTVFTSLKNSGNLPQFFDSMLNDEDLNEELYYTAKDILDTTMSGGQLAARSAVDEAEPFLKAIYSDELYKREFYDEDLLYHSYGMEKRDLLSIIETIVKEISSLGLVLKIISLITGNELLIKYALTLITKVFKSIDWSSLFTTLKNSSIVQSLFKKILSFLAGLFSGSSLSSLIEELFGTLSNSTHKSFLSSLLTIGIEVGEDLFKSLTGSSGLLSELLSTFLNGTSSSSSSSTGTSLLSLLSLLFGSSSSSSTSTDSTTTSSSTGLISTIFDALFGDSTSSDSSSSSSSGSTSLLSTLGSVADSLLSDLFGTSSSSLTTTSTAASSTASSSVFTSAQIKSCCCSASKIKKRALKRALRKKMKRSIKSTLTSRADLTEGLFNFVVAK